MIRKEVRDIFEVSWREAWTSETFRKKLIVGWILYIGVLLYLPHFFAMIQEKQGVLLPDPVLAILPSINMSAVIFALLYVTVIFTIFRAAKSPYLFLLYLWATLFISVSRLLTNNFVPLEPPVGLVSLVDPILLPFYGPNGITKDLFYSGHTASVFLTFLILRKKSEKIAALIATFIVGIALLFQHIHYTVDVVTAPIFVYLLFLLAKKFVLGTSEQKEFLYKARLKANTGNNSQAYYKRKSLKNT
jgi:hypothetical protein